MDKISKEGILRSKHSGWLYIDESMIDGEIGSVYEAMDEYAEQVALAFYRYAVTRAFSLGKAETLTSEEIYKLFIEPQVK